MDKINMNSTSSQSQIKSIIKPVLICLFLAISFCASESSAYRLNGGHGCRGSNCPELESCSHGIATDRYGFKVCALGPGDRCGSNNFPLHGDCGDGMFCYCGRCMGCSTHSYTCYDTTCY